MGMGYADYGRVGTEENGVVGIAPRHVASSTPLPYAKLDTIDLPTRANKGERASWVWMQQGDSKIAFLDTTLGTYTCEITMDMVWRLFFSNLIYTGEQITKDVILLDGWNRYKAQHKTKYKNGRARDREICIKKIGEMTAQYRGKESNLNQFSGLPYVPTARAQGYMKKLILESAICRDYMDVAEKQKGR